MGRNGFGMVVELPGIAFNFFSFFFLLVQHECIPQAILGMDVLCQAKSGMGKTAVFVLATLQQLEPVTGQVYLGRVLGKAFLVRDMWEMLLARFRFVSTSHSDDLLLSLTTRGSGECSVVSMSLTI